MVNLLLLTVGACILLAGLWVVLRSFRGRPRDRRRMAKRNMKVPYYF